MAWQDEHWNKLLWHCADNNSYKGCFLPEKEENVVDLGTETQQDNNTSYNWDGDGDANFNGGDDNWGEYHPQPPAGDNNWEDYSNRIPDGWGGGADNWGEGVPGADNWGENPTQADSWGEHPAADNWGQDTPEIAAKADNWGEGSPLPVPVPGDCGKVQKLCCEFESGYEFNFQKEVVALFCF